MRIKPAFVIGGAVSILVMVGIVMYGIRGLYIQPSGAPWTRVVVTRLPFPVARVEGKWVRYKDYLDQEDALRRFLQSPEAKAQGAPTEVDASAKTILMDQLIRAAAVQLLADEAGLKLTAEDIDRSYAGLLERGRASSTDDQEVRQYLADTFGWSEEAFKEHVVRPATLETAVRQEMYKDDAAAFQAALDAKMGKAVRYLRP